MKGEWFKLNDMVGFKIEGLINDLENDIDLLKNGHIYELEKCPGIPSCSTIGKRMQERLDMLVKLYEGMLQRK